ncbi:MAG: EAL domain-containing protein, partial [Kibdelosporangium sp.]
FGTGHSSLSRLHRLPIDRIKIDRSFIRDVHSDHQSYNIIKTVIVLSQSLGIACVVEGIETPEQLEVLRGLRAHMMQGYLLSKPMANDKVAGFLSARGELGAATAAA